MKRTRKRRAATRAKKGPLQLAHQKLCDAIHDLIAPRPQTHNGEIVWLASRYDELRDATNSRAHAAGYSTGTSRLPCWIDALKLVIAIDLRVTSMTGTRAPIPVLLRALARLPWRPQDADHITGITAEIQGFAQAIDDLFAPKPIYLPYPCPHCGQTHTHRLTDDGQRIRTPALAVSVTRGAWCQACHDTFDPFFLGRLLAAQPDHEGIPA